MKLIAVVGLLMMSSCGGNGDGENPFSTFKRRELHGHTYIILSLNNAGGLLHDVDCEKCAEKKERDKR